MHIIESIDRDALAHKWSFPKKFQALADAGVESYSVRFIDEFDRVYRGNFGVWHEPVPIGYAPCVLSDEFSTDGIKAAIMRSMRGQIDYIQFLVEIAAAGVSHYKVDMNKRTVTYFNEDETCFHEEKVPVWKE